MSLHHHSGNLRFVVLGYSFIFYNFIHTYIWIINISALNSVPEEYQKMNYALQTKSCPLQYHTLLLMRPKTIERMLVQLLLLKMIT